MREVPVVGTFLVYKERRGARGLVGFEVSY